MTEVKKFTDSLDDFIAIPRVTGLESRHGRSVASVATLSKKKDAYVTRLVEIGEQLKPLTRSKKGDSLAAIGERGELYFTSKRDDEFSEEEVHDTLWMLPPGGEARVVLRRPGGINSVTTAGGKLIISANTFANVKDEEENLKVAKDRKERGVTAILHESFPVRFWDHDLGPTYPRLYEAELPSLDGEDEIELKPIAVPAGKLAGVRVSDDADTILVTIENLVNGTTQVNSVYSIVGGETTLIAGETEPSEPGQSVTEYRGGAIAPSGKHAIISASNGNRDGFPLRSWLEIYSFETETKKVLTESFDDWTSETLWLDDETIIATAARKGRGSVYRVDVASGEFTLLTDDDYHYSNIGIIDGVLHCLRDSIIDPATPVTIDPQSGTVTELPRLTPEVTVTGTLTEVTTQAEDGTDLRAWLLLPDTDEPAPLAVFVHGGPWGSWNGWTWRWNPGPFAAKGYAVLMPDPAISTGYGQAMIDRGNDQLGGTPYTDILALVDEAEKRDDITGENTALLGGSYGGYMANWMAGHTGTRFSCIVSHASLWNIDIMGRTTDNGEWHEWMAPTQAGRYSPHRFVSGIEVPMLVIHGDRDYRVPVSQSQALWHALLRDSKAEGHKFLYYPDENHWILKPSNSRVWYETVLAFLDQHVRGNGWKRPELLG
ncbi:S9 family peptidase [Flaviflexus massiliensis]|uniref:S9 family peptidase n=1 Tax=Flaviflexus massiliensis TaxID=1522309 RepID=UPI0006D554B9|nr:alpha/beta fold hydrolase [Flaviflexus massiliensis]